MASTVNPVEHLWDVVEREYFIMDVQPTNQQRLCDTIMSKWTEISDECFQLLVESMPRRMKAVLKANVQPGTRKVYQIKWSVSVLRQSYHCSLERVLKKGSWFLQKDVTDKFCHFFLLFFILPASLHPLCVSEPAVGDGWTEIQNSLLWLAWLPAFYGCK